MRPFFSYYGAKYTVAKHLGEPKSDLVIEPFAGSACYSTYWEPVYAILIDKSPDVCAIWRFLIAATEADINALPDTFEHDSELDALPNGAQQLVRFWIAKGRAEPAANMSPWYFRYRNASDCRVWGPAVKERIARQLSRIRGWSVLNTSYFCAPNIAAHWHIDPPYNNGAGRRYPYSDLDYESLAAWCKSRLGHVDVCENQGADWLPFQHLCNVTSSRGRRDGAVSREAVYSTEAHP